MRKDAYSVCVCVILTYVWLIKIHSTDIVYRERQVFGNEGK